MSALPQLERELRAAAERRLARRRRLRLRRAGPAGLLVGAALVSGAAAQGWLTVERGRTDRGPYEIRAAPPRPAEQPHATTAHSRAGTHVRAVSGSHGQVCLELRMRALRPSYGCGERPNTAHPLGLVIVDATVQPGEWLAYGLVNSDTAAVRVGAHRTVPTHTKPGLPGRYFSALVPAGGRVWIAALDASGHHIGTVGSRSHSAQTPGSREQARALGYLAGFAPTARPASRWVYRDREIAQADAARQALSCVEDESPIVHCFKNPAEANAHARE